MDNKKFEKLIDLIINENEEQARALFHDIVVEKSREIYENIIAEEMEEEGFAGESADLLDEIGADVAGEEQGMAEGEEEGDEDQDLGGHGQADPVPFQDLEAAAGCRDTVKDFRQDQAVDNVTADFDILAKGRLVRHDSLPQHDDGSRSNYQLGPPSKFYA